MDKPNVTKFCDELKFNRFHWTLLVLGVLTLVFDGYDSQILAYVMPHVIKEWHLTPVAAGSIVSYGLVGLMIGTAGLGMLADRIGRKIPSCSVSSYFPCLMADSFGCTASRHSASSASLPA